MFKIGDTVKLSEEAVSPVKEPTPFKPLIQMGLLGR